MKLLIVIGNDDLHVVTRMVEEREILLFLHHVAEFKVTRILVDYYNKDITSEYTEQIYHQNLNYYNTKIRDLLLEY